MSARQRFRVTVSLTAAMTAVLAASALPDPACAAARYDWGASIRLRHEYWKNTFDFDNDKLDNRNFFRIKTSLWGAAYPDERAGIFMKLTNENKAYTYWGVQSTGDKDYRYDINELVIDNLYADIKNMCGAPVDLRVGRQDFPISMYGEGFLIADGTPRDGSRTYYFNAAKLAWHISEKDAVDFIALKASKTDDILPVANRQDGEQMLNYSDEHSFLLYHTSDAIERLRWEQYYIYKHESADRPAPLSEKGNIHTWGSYVKYSREPWTLRGQAAYQDGSLGTRERRAYAGYAYLDRDWEELSWSPRVSAGYTYMSGDDRATSAYEGFDQLFSTYTWVSELYNLSYQDETGTSYWTNLGMWRLAVSAACTQRFRITADCSYLRAEETRPGVHASFGDGKSRGYLGRLKGEYAFTKTVNGYVLAEYFQPGDFYADKADASVFVRTELQVAF